MSKYRFTAKEKINLVKRMYQDHGFEIDDIVHRLRYPKEAVEDIIKSYNLKHGEKSWRY